MKKKNRFIAMKCTRFIAMKYYKLIIKLMIKLKTVNYFYICSAKQKINNKKFYLFHQNNFFLNRYKI